LNVGSPASSNSTEVSGVREYRVPLLFRLSLGAVGVAFDPTCFLGVRHAESWRFVLRHHQDPSQDGALVIGGDEDPDLLELATIWRRGSTRGYVSIIILK
jgi:hypothetical protein